MRSRDIRPCARACRGHPRLYGHASLQKWLPARIPAHLLTVVLIASATALAGCATFSQDGGMGAVQDIAGAALEKK